MKTQVLQVDPAAPDQAVIAEAAAALDAGQIVAFATETVYGVGVDASNAAAVARLDALKDRPGGPYSIHMGNPHDLARYLTELTEPACRLIRRTWPGPVTMLLDAPDAFPDEALTSDRELYARLVTDGVLGVRCVAEETTAAILEAAGNPIIATSANHRGDPAPTTAKEVLASLDGEIDLLIDSGPTRYRGESSIVRFTPDTFTVVRPGAIDERLIKELAAKTIAFVCTGNSCRSPMAEGFAKKILADQLDCDPAKLPENGYKIVSFGTSALDGSPASANAIAAAREFGVDIRPHRSQNAAPDLILDCDLIFCLAARHLATVEPIAAMGGVECELLDEIDVADPYGGDLDIYRTAAEQIQTAIARRAHKGEL